MHSLFKIMVLALSQVLLLIEPFHPVENVKTNVIADGMESLKETISVKTTSPSNLKLINACIVTDSLMTVGLHSKETFAEDINLSEEMIYDEMMEVAQIVQAESGNQDLDGMRLVADVVLNRIDSDQFPDTAYEVIFQDGQFGPAVDGALEKAGWYICDDVFTAVAMEWEKNTRLDPGILYFNTTWDNGTSPYKHGDHWFSY